MPVKPGQIFLIKGSIDKKNKHAFRPALFRLSEDRPGRVPGGWKNSLGRTPRDGRGRRRRPAEKSFFSPEAAFLLIKYLKHFPGARPWLSGGKTEQVQIIS
jgi:hypothetical protein